MTPSKALVTAALLLACPPILHLCAVADFFALPRERLQQDFPTLLAKRRALDRELHAATGLNAFLCGMEEKLAAGGVGLPEATDAMIAYVRENRPVFLTYLGCSHGRSLRKAVGNNLVQRMRTGIELGFFPPATQSVLRGLLAELDTLSEQDGACAE